MANFHTHLTVAASASVIAGGLVAACGILNPIETISAIGLGIIGGFLPDVDSDHSTSISIIFGILAAISGFCAIFSLMPQWGIIIGISSWFIAFLVIRYGVIHIFRKLTIHRGIFHSIPMGILLSMLLVFSLYYLTADSLLAWMLGIFLFYGFCVHLLLDEFYSVNLSGVSLKRSFGSAFKLISFSHLIQYAILYALIAMLWFMLPKATELKAQFTQGKVYAHIKANLYPRSYSSVDNHQTV
ncbi:metal-dependent hydrolase [Thiotrichales bacterium 19S3-7]|nr:metal-dependent hydrolase [Thiotrichales bacterium 19S3-7]MCF6800954.1 metal-dependent hydrolase [Thiotrichales bacterium 19S3-11]